MNGCLLMLFSTSCGRLAKGPRQPWFPLLVTRLSSSATTTTSTATATATATMDTGTTAKASADTTATSITTTATTEQRIQARVAQRNAWHMYGVPKTEPSGGDARDFFYKLWTFAVPSQQELDRQFPVRAVDWTRLSLTPADDEQIQMTWLGHASLFVQMNGCSMLTDPVFSRRCSPSQWFGPARYRPAPCSIKELRAHQPQLDVVLLSHNHYDHLDYTSIRDIFHCYPSVTFVVPLGLQAWIHRWISPNCIVHELDWNETMQYTSPLDMQRRSTLPPFP